MLTLLSLFLAFFTLNPAAVSDHETRDLDAFKYLDVSGSISVELIASNEHKVDIEMLRGNIEDLITEVNGKTLKLKFKSKGFNWNSNNKNKAKVKVYYSMLDGIDASAGSNVRSESEVNADNMEIDVSSGASVKVSFDVEKLDVDISSGGSVKVSGEATKQYVDISSGASYIANDLKSKWCSVDASSGASAKVWVEEELEADASSGASIRYGGDPKHKDIDAGKYSGGSIREM